MLKIFISTLLFNIVLSGDLIKKYYDTGELESVTNNQYGVSNGEASYYYRNGLLKATFVYKNDRRVSEIRYYYSKNNDVFSSNHQIIKKNNQRYSGKMVILFESTRHGIVNIHGKVREEYFVSNGKKEGKEILYWDNGRLRNITYYKNGLKHGKNTAYWHDGNILWSEMYNHGNKE